MRKKLCCCLLLMFAGCVDVVASATKGKISTIEVQLVDPAPTATGAVGAPIPTLSSVTVNILVHDDSGAILTQDVSMDVYISFGGIKLGLVDGCSDTAPDAVPIETIMVPGGRLMNHTITLPEAFGKTNIWIEDTVQHVAGASADIYFANPTVAQVNTPVDPTAANATYCSRFDKQYITIDTPTGSGKLVVSSLFTNAFVITDTGASTYNSIYVYSFSQPPDFFAPGTVISSISGNLSKFVGFSEFNFPTFDLPHMTDSMGNNIACTFDSDCPATGGCNGGICELSTPEPQLVPAPVPVDVTMMAQSIALLPYDAAVVTTTGTICDPSPPNPTNNAFIQSNIDSWNNFDTWVVGGQPGSDCQSVDNFAVAMPSKVYGTFDPTMLVGQTVTVVGMLKNSSGRNNVVDADGASIMCTVTTDCPSGTCVDNLCKKGPFNFWTIQPRTSMDITVGGTATARTSTTTN